MEVEGHPPPPADLCFNCCSPINPQEGTVYPVIAGEFAPSNSELRRLSYLLPFNVTDHQLKDQLARFTPKQKATCHSCSEELRLLMEARSRFRQATAVGSGMSRLQSNLMVKLGNEGTGGIPDARIKIEELQQQQQRGRFQSSRPEIKIKNEPCSTSSASGPTVSTSTNPSIKRGSDLLFQDWRQAYKAAKLVFNCLEDPEMKKKTIKEINDYILDEEPNFFRKNTEPNVIPRVLNQYFWNSSMCTYTMRGRMMKKRGGRGPSVSARGGSECSGSTARWTIHRNYSELRYIHRHLSETHSPPAEEDCRPGSNQYAEGDRRSRSNSRSHRSRSPRLNRSTSSKNCNNNNNNNEITPIPVPQPQITDKASVITPTPPKKRKVEEGAQGPQVKELTLAALEDAGWKVEDEVVEEEEEGEQDKKEDKNVETAEIKPESKTKALAQVDQKNSKDSSSSRSTYIDRTSMKALQEQLQALHIIVDNMKMLLPTKLGTQDEEVVRKMLEPTKKLWTIIDELLLQVGSYSRLPTTTYSPPSKLTTESMSVDTLAKYFQCLLICEDLLLLDAYTRFHVVIELMKLRLLRLISTEVKRQINSKLKSSDDNDKESPMMTTAKIAAAAEVFFSNIAIFLKLDDQEKQLNEFSEGKVLRAWRLVIFHLLTTTYDGDKTKTSDLALDQFATAIDHQTLGPTGFLEKLDKIRRTSSISSITVTASTDSTSNSVPVPTVAV